MTHEMNFDRSKILDLVFRKGDQQKYTLTFKEGDVDFDITGYSFQCEGIDLVISVGDNSNQLVFQQGADGPRPSNFWKLFEFVNKQTVFTGYALYIDGVSSDAVTVSQVDEVYIDGHVLTVTIE